MIYREEFACGGSWGSSRLCHTRQDQLNFILADLRKIEGITLVKQDDFDSVSINVFLTLAVESRSCMTSSRRAKRFSRPLRSIKDAIKRAIHEVFSTTPGNEVVFKFLDWPTKKYISDGGRPAGRLDDGYTHEHIKIEIYVAAIDKLGVISGS